MDDTPGGGHAPQVMASQALFQERPQVKIVRSSGRRKFLVGALGSVAILGLGGPVLAHLAQNVWAAVNSKGFPYDSNWWVSSYSFDLNFAALFNENDGSLRVWDYQQQRMISLFNSDSHLNLSAWSPDNCYLLCQTTQGSLDMWDVQARQKIRSFSDDKYPFNDDSNYENFDKIRWSPDGSRVALFLKDSLAILDTKQLTPLLTLRLPTDTSVFAWSPDARKVALLVGKDEASSWRVQIWNLSTSQKEMEVSFQGQESGRRNVLLWAPTGEYLAALAHQQLQIIHLTQPVSSYALDVPIDGGALAWSPDGRHLAVAAGKHITNFTSGPVNSDIGVWDVVEKSKFCILNNDTAMNLTPSAMSCSKDGKRITAIIQLYQQTNWYWF